MSLAQQGPYSTQPLAAFHNRQAFQCGVPSLNAYLKTQAAQEARRKSTAVFVFVREAEIETILGYFTLSCFATEREGIPDQARKHLRRYAQIGATLIGRFAVTQSEQGRGIGRRMLAAALTTAYRNADVVGSAMVVVEALDESAAAFYAAHGFLRMPESMRLILPMTTAGKYLANLKN